MYRPPVDRLERLLKLVVFPVVLAVLFIVVFYWAGAEEPEQSGFQGTGFLVDAVKADPSKSIVTHMYTVFVNDDASDVQVQPLFPGGRPVVGKCYAQQAVAAHNGVGLVLVEQPCWAKEEPTCVDTEAGKFCYTTGMFASQQKTCVQGWCITREEQP